jgi:putative sulfotransferase
MSMNISTNMRMPPAFVVGTGRCGSTMVSNMLREHPRLASLSEFFSLVTDLGGRIAESFPEGAIDSTHFWRLVAAPHAKQTLMHREDVAMPEVLYRPGPGRRFTAEGGVPAIMQTTLPHLSDDPEQLFDEARDFVLAQPPAPAAVHYARLFGFLAQRQGKQGWVERSGGSLRLVRRLHRAFPDARFVHVTRNGRDCAVSMSQHLGFRMALVSMALTEFLGADPFESADRRWAADIPDEFAPFLPEAFEREAFLRHETAPSLCAHYWSGEIVEGLRDLAEVPSDRVLTLRYEDFLEAPEPTIRRLVAFLDKESVDEAWIRQVARTVRAARSAWTELPPRERERLRRACEPGFAALSELYPA